MAHEVGVIYGEVEIKYHEQTNTWKFELRGRSRSAESLAKAKEFIDAPEPVAKKPFKKFDCYYLKSNYYSNGPTFETVTVTSYTEAHETRAEAWITHTDKTREKVRVEMLFPLDNRAQLDEYLALYKKRLEAEKTAEKFLKLMKRIPSTPEE